MDRKKILRILYLVVGVLLLTFSWFEYASAGLSLDTVLPGIGGLVLCGFSAMGWG